MLLAITITIVVCTATSLQPKRQWFICQRSNCQLAASEVVIITGRVWPWRLNIPLEQIRSFFDVLLLTVSFICLFICFSNLISFSCNKGTIHRRAPKE